MRSDRLERLRRQQSDAIHRHHNCSIIIIIFSISLTTEVTTSPNTTPPHGNVKFKYSKYLFGNVRYFNSSCFKGDVRRSMKLTNKIGQQKSVVSHAKIGRFGHKLRRRHIRFKLIWVREKYTFYWCIEFVFQSDISSCKTFWSPLVHSPIVYSWS